MTLEKRLSKHPYLQPVAEFHAQVAEAARSIPITYCQIPNWPDYLDDYKHGLPVLRTSHAAVDSACAERIITRLIEKLASMPLVQEIRRQSLELCAQLHGDSEMPQRAIAWLLGNDDFAFAHPGLFRHLGWTALARYLGPLVTAFETWRDEELWLHHYCPVCGSGPSMAQLVGTEPGRRRFLVCGCCGARWRFSRMACPFCEQANGHRLSVLAVEGEKQLRVDYCDSCSGYVKTYVGEGSESVLLTDWTSLHIDVLAKDRGLKRLAYSLYEI